MKYLMPYNFRFLRLLSVFDSNFLLFPEKCKLGESGGHVSLVLQELGSQMKLLSVLEGPRGGKIFLLSLNTIRNALKCKKNEKKIFF